MEIGNLVAGAIVHHALHKFARTVHTLRCASGNRLRFRAPCEHAVPYFPLLSSDCTAFFRIIEASAADDPAIERKFNVMIIARTFAPANRANSCLN